MWLIPPDETNTELPGIRANKARLDSECWLCWFCRNFSAASQIKWGLLGAACRSSQFKPPELRRTNNSNHYSFILIFFFFLEGIKEKHFLAKWSLTQSLINSGENINKTFAAAHLETFQLIYSWFIDTWSCSLCSSPWEIN